MRKLPSPQKVDRLYWLEEWTQAKIAKKFQCTASAVYQFMRSHGLKARRGRRKTAECIVPECEEPTCRIKKWKEGEFYFVWTNRCAKHHHEKVRERMCRVQRKRRGYRGRKMRTPCTALELGQLSTIARED